MRAVPYPPYSLELSHFELLLISINIAQTSRKKNFIPTKKRKLNLINGYLQKVYSSFGLGSIP